MAIVEETINDKHYKVKYDKLGTMAEFFTFLELQNIPSSQNMKDAIKEGCKPDEEFNWDIIYEVVTSKGDFLCMRKHLY